MGIFGLLIFGDGVLWVFLFCLGGLSEFRVLSFWVVRVIGFFGVYFSVVGRFFLGIVVVFFSLFFLKRFFESVGFNFFYFRLFVVFVLRVFGGVF